MVRGFVNIRCNTQVYRMRLYQWRAFLERRATGQQADPKDFAIRAVMIDEDVSGWHEYDFSDQLEDYLQSRVR